MAQPGKQKQNFVEKFPYSRFIWLFPHCIAPDRKVRFDMLLMTLSHPF